ncbi:MAG: DUF2975 domain-containing protein [Bacteroidetes bacterium]|nr:DUF2975 domain-containing protein [Bacteroidota bacterium]
MKNLSLLVLQVIVLIICAGTLVFLLWEPHLEGRHVHSTVFKIYFTDPFLAFVYIGSIPFFVGGYQILRQLNQARTGSVFTKEALRTIRIIQVCGVLLLCFVVTGEGIILMNTTDDRAGGVAMGLFSALFAATLLAGATVLKGTLGEGVRLKSDKETGDQGR